jgi:hypothetical protein
VADLEQAIAEAQQEVDTLAYSTNTGLTYAEARDRYATLRELRARREEVASVPCRFISGVGCPHTVINATGEFARDESCFRCVRLAVLDEEIRKELEP